MISQNILTMLIFTPIFALWFYVLFKLVATIIRR